MPGQLFTSYFLEEGILHTTAWQESLSQPSHFEDGYARAESLIYIASKLPITASGLSANNPPSNGITIPEIQRDSLLAT